eukprot:c11399_g1_i1.p1 GENE.c11399_g1_i1~~c11399_g1_i1.p1  ORF type:complete len:206 (+),score=40.38 c11399_g1_i1:53-619(+)
MTEIDDGMDFVLRQAQVLERGRDVAGQTSGQAQQSDPNLWGAFWDNTAFAKAQPASEVTSLGPANCSRVSTNVSRFLPNYSIILVLLMVAITAFTHWQKAAIFGGGCFLLHCGYALVLSSVGNKPILRFCFVTCLVLFVVAAILLCTAWAWIGFVAVIFLAFTHSLLATPKTLQQQQHNSQQPHQPLP